MKARFFVPLLGFILCALGTFTARADLVLTNYTAANPLKILPIGDSITDDTVTNGAWRAELEPLLLSNGYAFTNIGRWASAPQTNFVRVNHEGMDGSVIAAPGVSGPTHGYASNENYSLLTVADALNTLSNTMPDLVLIDMGVNDMGRGRNPYYVATNDYSALLDLIFSHAPAAYIIISKPTTLFYSSILGYSAYHTNMYAFCDAVQALAAARRAQGQNVYVADMFSQVNHFMLNSDGLHPNAVGRAAIAGEFMFRIASITQQTNAVMTPFILGGSVWKYSDKGLNLGTNWSQPGYDDSTWSQGAGRLGYSLPGVTTTVGYGTNSSNKYITTYFRHPFVVPANVSYTNLSVRLDYIDGAVVYLNGRELYRANMAAGTVTYQTTAQNFVYQTGDVPNTYSPTNLPIGSLSAGTNVIAVEIHKYSASGTGISFDLELFGQGVYVPPTLSFSSIPGAVQLAWPAIYTNFSLQSTLDLSSWQSIPGPYPQSNNSFQVSLPINTNSAQFFRLINP